MRACRPTTDPRGIVENSYILQEREDRLAKPVLRAKIMAHEAFGFDLAGAARLRYVQKRRSPCHYLPS